MPISRATARRVTASSVPSRSINERAPADDLLGQASALARGHFAAALAVPPLVDGL